MPTSPLVQMWIQTNRYLVCMKDPQLIHASSLRRYKSRYKKIKQFQSQNRNVIINFGRNNIIKNGQIQVLKRGLCIRGISLIKLEL